MQAGTANSTTFGDASGKLTKSAWAALLVLCAALFLDALDVSMTGVALPSIDADFDLSTSSLQWVVSAYVLGYGGFLLLGGRAADLLGRRRMFLISLGVFVVASGLGALANDGTLLIATRFIKGIAAGFTAPAGLSIITTNFAEGAARNKALAIYTATGATGFSLGLVFSGVLTEIDWRLVFAFPAPLALLTLFAAIRLVPNDGIPERTSSRFDALGAVALTAGMLLLVFSLVEAPEQGWASARTLGGLGIAAAHPRRLRRSRAAHGRATGAPRNPSLRAARAGEPGCDGADRRLVRVPVHRHALHAAVARVDTDRDRPGDLPRRPARRLDRAADGAADRALRGGAPGRARARLDGDRLRALPPDRAGLDRMPWRCCRRSSSPGSGSRSRMDR